MAVQQGRSEQLTIAHPSLLVDFSQGWSGEFPTARVQRGESATARCASTGDSPGHPSLPCYRIVASKLTLAFMELDIRQFASAFSINSLALVASVLATSVMVGFNVMAVN